MEKLFLAVLVTAAVGLSGCERRDGETPEIRISPTIRTRVTGVHFDTGDCIGLRVVRSSETYVQNQMLTYDGSAFTASGLLWYNDLNDESTLTAYYPYSSSGVPAEFTVAADQTTGCTLSDLLVAVKERVTPGAAPVGMLFYHVMSQLTILVDNKSAAPVSGVTVGGFVPTAEVNYTTQTAAAKSGAVASDVAVFQVTANASYRVILVPQEAELTVIVRTSDGKTRSKTLSSAKLESGRRYDLSVVVTNIDISLSLSGEIDDWEDGGSLGGDNGGGSDGGSGEGGGESGDQTLTYEGETYRTTTVADRVWMAENLRLQPAGTTISNGIWYPKDGASVVATQGMLYNYATATGGVAAVAGIPLRGICPPGWHIPDTDELSALMGTASGSFFCCASYWLVNSTTSNYGQSGKGFLMSSTLSGEGKWKTLNYMESNNNKPSASEISVEYGISLRCVRDVK